MEEIKNILSELKLSYEKLDALYTNPKFSFRMDYKKASESLRDTVISLERLINKVR